MTLIADALARQAAQRRLLGLTLIADALARQAEQPAPRRIDYATMQRLHPIQQAALTRAIKTKDAEQIAKVCKTAIGAWNAIGAWPDDWHRWQAALDDALPWNQHIDIGEL